MQSAPGVLSLGRALLSLARSQTSGVLRVRTDAGSARIALVSGVVRAASALPGGDRTLGDVLVADGALDIAAHARALHTGLPPFAPVGRWLIDAGLASRPAVELALRRQLRERVLALLRAQVLDFALEPGLAEIDVPFIEGPLPSADLVLCALRLHVAAFSQAALLEPVPLGELVLTALGEQLARDAALWPEEAAVIALLRRRASRAQVLQATASAPRALCMLCMLALLSGLRGLTPASARCALLVHKRAQLARAEGPRALLDLAGDDSPRAARRALRRMASALHPDAFGPHAPAALRRASAEVLAALIDAERTLRVVAQRP